MKPVLLAGLRSNVRRWGALALVIALAVGFLTASLGVGDLMVKRGVKTVEESTRGASVVIHEIGGEQAYAAAEKAVKDSGAESFRPRQDVWEITAGDSTGPLMVAGVRPPHFGPQKTLSGRLPSTEREIALDQRFMEKKGLRLGDSVTVGSYTAEGSQDSTLTIVGTIAEEPYSDWASGIVVNSLAARNTAVAWADMILLAGADPDRFSTLKEVTVTTPSALIEKTRQDQSQRASVLPFLLFSVISLVVSVLVISTTMSVLTARRVKELALFRLIGATRSTITGAIILEGIILGGAASLLGLGLGIGALYAATRLLPGFSEISFVPSVPNLVLPWLMGIAATLLGSLPALRLASGVRPLQAVTQDINTLEKTRGRSVGRVLALVVFVVSTIGVYVSSDQNKIGIAVLLGAVSAISLIPVFTWLAPRIAAWVPRVLSRSTAARLASANIASSPSRAGTTSTALLIGITLVTMLLAGVSTSKVAAVAAIDHDSPFDVEIQLIDYEAMDRAWAERPADAPDSWSPPLTRMPLSDSQLERLRTIPGVTAAEVLTPIWKGTESAADAMTMPAPVLYALPEDISSVARGDLPHLKDRQVFGEGNATDGRPTITLPEKISGPQGTITLEPGMKTFSGSLTMAVTAATARELGVTDVPDEPKVLVMKLDDDVTLESLTKIQEQISGVLGTAMPGMGGGAMWRLMTLTMLDILLTVALALLALSVIIAVIGVSDSLALSQLERTREASLLRALGMSRRGVGAIITWESIGLTLAALLVGVPMGIYYGWTGSLALTPMDTIAGSTPSVDPLWLGVTIVGGLLLAIASSVIPARRSQRITPSEGLAQE